MIEELGFISITLSNIVKYIDTVLGGNQFAVGAVVAGLSATGLYLLKSLPIKIFEFLEKHLTTSFEINNTNESFYILSTYLNKINIIKQSRYIKASNGRFGHSRIIKEIGYGDQIFWLNWYTPILISSYKEDSTSEKVKEFLKIKKIGRNHAFFNKLFKQLDDKLDDESKTKFYKYQNEYREYITKQPKRTFDSIIISEKDKKYLLNSIDKFVSNEKWCLKYQIPYQLGILLKGPPGTGKTSIIKAIASYLNKDIVFVQDEVTLSIAAQSVLDCIIVAEEIDTFALAKRKKRKNQSTKDKEENDENNPIQAVMESLGKPALSKLLNALDGIISNHGRIVIMTTNYPEDLDLALIRPGRIDIQLYMGYLTNETFELLIKRFFNNNFIIPSDYYVIDKLTTVLVQRDIINGLNINELIEKYMVKKK